MNKMEFVEKLACELNIDKETCLIINEILERNFFISRNSKGKILDELVSRLEIQKEVALKIYDVAIDIVNLELKKKFRHPFTSKD